MKFIKTKKGLILSSFLASATLLLAAFLPEGNPNEYLGQTKAEFVKAHKIEAGDLFLTDNISDIIKFNDGYIVGEEYKSTLLHLNGDLEPVRRIGKKGDGPNELRILGALQQVGDKIAAIDQGHARVVLMNAEGKIENQIKSDYLAGEIFNVNVVNNRLTFFIADNEEPIVVTDFEDKKLVMKPHKVLNFRSRIQARFGNKGFVKNVDDKYIYFPPTETSIELLDNDFNRLNILDFGKLEFLKPSVRRAEAVYKSVSNQTVQLYEDVYQDGNRFYLLAYSDDISTGEYKRSINHVIEVSYESQSSELWVSRVIELTQSRAYTEILVDGDKLLAFNYQDFTLDEYSIRK